MPRSPLESRSNNNGMINSEQESGSSRFLPPTLGTPYFMLGRVFLYGVPTYHAYLSISLLLLLFINL